MNFDFFIGPILSSRDREAATFLYFRLPSFSGETSVHLTIPPADSASSSYLSIDLAYWDITSWSPTRVIAEQRALCRRNVLTVDATAQQVFQIQTDLKSTDAA